MVERTYKCDLCHTSTEARELVGLWWTFVGEARRIGWDRRPPEDVERHICKSCVEDIQRIKAT